MTIEEIVVDWVEYYSGQFHLPVEERGGYVMLPVTDRLCVVHMPKELAKRVLDALLENGVPAPCWPGRGGGRCSHPSTALPDFTS